MTPAHHPFYASGLALVLAFAIIAYIAALGMLR